MKKTVVIIILTMVMFNTASITGCTPTDTQTDTFSAGQNPSVEVSVGNGNVTLVVGSDSEITVTANLKNPDNIEYTISQEGDGVTVDADTRSGSRADVTLTVPETTRFTVSIGSGGVDVTDIQASGQVRSGSGSISLEETSGDVEIDTGSGNITLSGVSGSFNVDTASGNITLRDSTGSFSFNSASGNVNVDESKGTFVLNSASGFIKFQGELAQGSDNRLTTASGSVTVQFLGSPSVELELESQQSGRFRVDLPVTVSEQSEYRLIGTIGDGEASLYVRTGSGNITIR